MTNHDAELAARSGGLANTSLPLNRLGHSFENDELERAFREHHLETDCIQLRMTCMVFLLPVCAFVLNDVRIATAAGSGFGFVFAVRSAVLAITVLVASSAKRIRSHVTLDALSFIFVLSAMVMILIVDASRPKDYFAHLGADISALMALYLILPAPQMLRYLAATIFSGGLFVLHLGYKEPEDGLTTTAVVVAVIVANLLGAMFSIRLASARRGQFSLLQREAESRRRLEQALESINTLEGMIPICAECKKVRNDDGFWEQVEAFVATRSRAEFSHGLCPDCNDEYAKG